MLWRGGCLSCHSCSRPPETVEAWECCQGFPTPKHRCAVGHKGAPANCLLISRLVNRGGLREGGWKKDRHSSIQGHRGKQGGVHSAYCSREPLCHPGRMCEAGTSWATTVALACLQLKRFCAERSMCQGSGWSRIVQTALRGAYPEVLPTVRT